MVVLRPPATKFEVLQQPSWGIGPGPGSQPASEAARSEWGRRMHTEPETIHSAQAEASAYEFSVTGN
ncbi:uncharacterized protein THITE_2108607 [Thermothielavioides terrestris NRRL 8126]|uniref:Uncharacterized protein n=1 Tax=Thermothielavioides terrestris (strain ATCC 38088 / NRRL 8126) TaxID=578455 RepID=G2QS13_THETT|nr:uncharacterized protein THITE_2108607 [Thermothielavioides terrestris NRRL 8126]AEO63403.1 hypothetical protein THITE_2108607 [Thermothielavioides terrestris NRRL 8126]